MLELSKLLKIIKFISFFMIFLSLQSCSVEDKKLLFEDLKKPETLVQYIKNGVSEENRKLAQSLYDGGLKKGRPKRASSWGAPVKYFTESALLYPSAKTLVSLSEAESFFISDADDKFRLETLSTIKKYLISAIAVDEIQKELSKDEVAKVKNDIACIGDFLKSKIKKDDCIYVATTLNTLKKD